MNGATQTNHHGLTPEQYIRMLSDVRGHAAKTKLGITVSGLVRHNSLWIAVTSAGEIPVRDLAAWAADEAEVISPARKGIN